MEFNFGGKGHVLRGLKGQKIKIMENKELPKAIVRGNLLDINQRVP